MKPEILNPKLQIMKSYNLQKYEIVISEIVKNKRCEIQTFETW